MKVISIKPINFKSFYKENLVNIKLKPLNLIFGPNSSGKSSYLQSLSFLKLNTEHLTAKDFVFRESNINSTNIVNYSANPIKFVSSGLDLVDFDRTFHQNYQQSLLDNQLLDDSFNEVSNLIDEVELHQEKMKEFIDAIKLNNPDIKENGSVENYDFELFENLISQLIKIRDRVNILKSGLSKKDSVMSSKISILELDTLLNKMNINFEQEEILPDSVKLIDLIELTNYTLSIIESLGNLNNYFLTLSKTDQSISFEYLISTSENENEYLLNDGAEYSSLKFITDEIKFRLKIAKDRNKNEVTTKSHSIYIEKLSDLKNLKVKNLPEKLSFENIDLEGNEKNIYFDFPELYALSLIYSFDEIIEDSFKGYDSGIKDYLNKTYFDDRLSNQNNKFDNFKNNNYFQLWDGKNSKVLKNIDSEEHLDKFIEGNSLETFIELISRFDDDLFQSRRRGKDDGENNYREYFTEINGNSITQENYSFDNEFGTWISESNIWQKYGFKFNNVNAEFIADVDASTEDLEDIAYEQNNKIFFTLSEFPWHIYTIQRAASNSLDSKKLKEIDYEKVLKLVKDGLKKIQSSKKEGGKIILGSDIFPILEKTSYGKFNDFFSSEENYTYDIFKDMIFKPVFNYLLNKNSKINDYELDHLFELLQNSRAFTPDLGKLFNKIIEACIESSKSFDHIGPIRHKPERLINRTYKNTSSVGFEGENAIHFLRKEDVKNEVNYVIREILKLPYEVNINEIETSLGTYNYFQLLRPGTSKELSLSDVGYGISQILPLIVQSVQYWLYNQEGLIAIEEPELHLHPSLQSKLADMFFYFIRKTSGNIKYIIETHSENIIYRILKYVKDDKKMKEATSLNWNEVVSFYFFEIDKSNLYTEIQLLSFDNEGVFDDDLPRSFVDNKYEAITSDVNPWEELLNDLNNRDNDELSDKDEDEVIENEDNEEEIINENVIYASQEYPELKLIELNNEDYTTLICSNCKKEFSTLNGGKWHINSGWCLGMSYDV